MSIVITTHDHYQKARLKTRDEESKIDVRSQLNGWTKRELISQKLMAGLLAMIIFPLLLAWAAVIAGVAFAFTVSLGLLRFFGAIFIRKKSKLDFGR